jgi:hypothetical protein
MKNFLILFVICTFYASLLNAFNNDDNNTLSFSDFNVYAFTQNTGSDTNSNSNSELDNSSIDDCFDEYIVQDSYFTEHLKSKLYYTYLINSPNSISVNIWRPPQNS